MVGQGVHHRAGPTDCRVSVFRGPEDRISSINNVQSFDPAGAQSLLEPCAEAKPTASVVERIVSCMLRFFQFEL